MDGSSRHAQRAAQSSGRAQRPAPPGVPALDRLGAPLRPPSAAALRLLACIAEGCTNEDLAAETGQAVQTVRNRVSDLLRLLHVPNRTAAVVLALQLRWLDLDSLHVRHTPA